MKKKCETIIGRYIYCNSILSIPTPIERDHSGYSIIFLFTVRVHLVLYISRIINMNNIKQP